MPATVTEALRLGAAGQLLLVLGLLLRDHRRSRVALGSTALIACVVSYLLLPVLHRAALPTLIRSAADLGALAVPFALWLAARLYFEDSFETKPAHVAALAALAGLRALVMPWPWAVSAVAIPVVLDALRRIHTGASSDLLLSRLRLRYVVVLGSGAYALLVLVAEAFLPRDSSAAAVMNALNDVGLFLLIGAISLLVLRIEPELVKTTTKRPAPAPQPPTVLEKRLDRLINEECIYRTEGLTIGDLAGRLGEQEYKVRQLINTHLGFRNFGAFLNHYRVQEAQKLLADPALKNLGVAEIAYRLGYSSLGPFNRAFKETVAQTPTEYRKAAQEQLLPADSEIGEPFSKRR